MTAVSLVVPILGQLVAEASVPHSNVSSHRRQAVGQQRVRDSRRPKEEARRPLEGQAPLPPAVHRAPLLLSYPPPALCLPASAPGLPHNGGTAISVIIVSIGTRTTRQATHHGRNGRFSFLCGSFLSSLACLTVHIEDRSTYHARHTRTHAHTWTTDTAWTTHRTPSLLFCL